MDEINTLELSFYELCHITSALCTVIDEMRARGIQDAYLDETKRIRDKILAAIGAKQ